MIRSIVALCMAALGLLALLVQPAAAQDARAVLAEASRAMGADNLDSIRFYGSGANFTLGQSNNANGQWPRTNLNDYWRAIDFTQPASRATAVTWVAPVTGGPAAQGAFNQVIAPTAAWAQQHEIWITPWGFLKGAAANNATLGSETLDGQRYRVLTWSPPQTAPSGASYKVVGYIDDRNLVTKVRTWVENPIFGDMLVEADYSEYRDANGVKYPAAIVERRGGHPTFEAQILGINSNPSDIAELLTPPARPGGGFGFGPPPGRDGPTSEKLAEGVWRINGFYNALAVEFADHIVLFEPGPQNEARAQAIMAEARRVIPNKPIRYGVISHHHFDHTGGLAAVVAEGITIVTPEVNKAFLENALGAPRTLVGDALARSGRKPVIEGFAGDERVFEDSTRTLEIHVIKGLPHADGLVVAYLPREKILVYADMFNLPPPSDPVPDPPVVGTGVFLANIERLGLEPERIMSVHSLNPDRLTTVAEIRASRGLPPSGQ